MANGLDVEQLAKERQGVEIKDIDKGKKKKSFNFKKPARKKEPTLKKPKDGRLIAIDIGARFIKVVEGKYKRDRVQVINAMKIESSTEFVKDGDLFSLPNIISLLKVNFAQRNMNTKDLVFVMGGNQIISREISVIYNPNIGASEFKMLIANELEQYLPINLDEYDLQYREIEKIEEGGEPRIKVLVVACPKNVVRTFLQVAEEIGEKKKPYALDLANNAITKIYNFADSINGTTVNKKEAAMLIDMGSKAMNVSILNAGVLEFMRTIPGGGFEIDNNIGLDIGISASEAEDLKIEKCDLNNKENSYNIIAKEVISSSLDEIERIVNFYGNKTKKRVEKIYIYGGAAKLKGLPKFIKDRLNIEVVKIEDVNNIEVSKAVVINNLDQYLNAIGSLIRL